MKILIIFALLLLALVVGSLWLRWLSWRRPRPCPVWLALTFERLLPDTILDPQSTLDRMGLRPGQRVLEIGPGTGRVLIPAAQRVLPGGKVVGIEIQPGMLEELKLRAKQLDISNLTTILGDATQPHVPPESFDVVYLCGTLGEIPDREAALRQCYVALKPGGQCSITEIFPDPDFQPRATVLRLADASGFRFQEIHGRWYYFTANFVKASSSQQAPGS